jgi:hypothetical protein
MTGRAGILVLAMAALAPWAVAASDAVTAILDQARGTPAEIFADVAFRLIDAGKITGKDQVALLDEVFLRADEARQPIVTRPVTVDQHLDGLSIKCRAVKALLSVDEKRARERFSEIAPPQMPKPGCKESVLQDPTVYFDTLAAVVTKAPFTAEEQKKQVPFWMVADAVRRIRTSIEIIAAARNLSHLAHTEKEALAMSSAFAAALSIDDCDRNFSGAMRASLVDAVLMAGDRFARLGAPPQSMQAALRGYLVRHLTASRCEDSPDATDSVSLFNKMLTGQTAVLPISEDESKPAKREGKAEKTRTADFAGFNELASQINALSGKDPASVGKPKAPHFDDFKDPDAADVEKALAKLRDWKGSADEDAVEAFHFKAGLYFSMLSLPPRLRTAVSFRPAVLSGLIVTLEDAAILDVSPSDWLSEVRKLERVTVYVDDRGEFLRLDNTPAMLNASVSALQVYGKLARLER